MRLLITGGCGFLGSNLAAAGLRRQEEVLVFDNLSRLGATENRAWLESIGTFKFVEGDIRSYEVVEGIVKNFRPEVVFHLAGQVAMTTSIENPQLDFQINTVGTHNVLEALRRYQPETLLVYSSTNKVYGDLDALRIEESPTRYQLVDFPEGLDEKTALDFRSPYGCSKGAADQYVLDYARVFQMNTVVFRHSSIFGDRQFSTSEQGWIGWFVNEALHRKRGLTDEPLTISGTGKQVRDILFSSDLVRLYFATTTHVSTVRGEAFNIGGGSRNSLSLIELFLWLSERLEMKLPFKSLPARRSDQKVFVADITKAQRLLEWSPVIQKDDGLEKMIRWLETQ